jgi:hypothetical protein
MGPGARGERVSEHQIYIVAVAKPGEPMGPVKIGISSNVAARLATLQTACPYPLQLVHVFTAPDLECARRTERTFHEVQAQHRSHGEWFNLSPIVALQLMCLNLEVIFKFLCKFDGEELDAAREMSGLASAFDKFPEFAAEARKLQ